MGSRALLRSTYELRLELTKCPPPKYESSVRLFFVVKRYSLRRLPPAYSGLFEPRMVVSTKCGPGNTGKQQGKVLGYLAATLVTHHRAMIGAPARDNLASPTLRVVHTPTRVPTT